MSLEVAVEKRRRETIEEMVSRLQQDPEYILERLKLDIAEDIYAEMARRRINQSQLAELLGMYPSNVSTMLGGRNFRLSTLCKIASKLGLKIEVKMKRRRKGG